MPKHSDLGSSARHVCSLKQLPAAVQAIFCVVPAPLLLPVAQVSRKHAAGLGVQNNSQEEYLVGFILFSLVY